MSQVGEVFAEFVAEFDEVGGHLVVFERPLFEQSEECGSLDGVELDGASGAGGAEHDAEARRLVDVLQAGHQCLAFGPADGDVAAAERDGDGVEAFGHRRHPTALLALAMRAGRRCRFARRVRQAACSRWRALPGSPPARHPIQCASGSVCSPSDPEQHAGALARSWHCDLRWHCDFRSAPGVRRRRRSGRGPPLILAPSSSWYRLGGYVSRARRARVRSGRGKWDVAQCGPARRGGFPRC